ncbi:glycosyltransferase [Mycobacterium sp. GA-1841]|uniref:glycosyltransferase family 4 protein n=1 Tax=Mycobacterium sp. GA-1841 TaxID=1834154 RepID=UPI00096EF493|nr:glycosyltransferase family 4 protein [Mycobacterium sp. GA-1841]OMC29666.1 glycosyltransferase [Mycobacterium sp. GA-1841]
MSVSSVVFVAHTAQVSGAEKVLSDLVDEALTRGYAVTVACPNGPLSQVLPAGCTHMPIPSLGLGGERGPARGVAAVKLAARWWWTGRALRRVVGRASTVTVVNSLFALPAMRLAAPPRGVSWLVHDTVVSAKQRVVIRLARPVVRRAVAVSEATAAPLRAAGIPVSVAHNGVRRPVARLGGKLHDPPVVGMLALLTPWKGHRVLLDAAARLPGVQVELAGGSFPSDADYVAELEARAASPELAGRVRFLGHVDAPAALGRWDVMVSASVLPEAGPLSVLESMAHGVPVIGTNHGGTVEFLAGGAGLLVPPDDAEALAGAIRTVLDDDALRGRMVETARCRIDAGHDISRTLPILLDTVLGLR